MEDYLITTSDFLGEGVATHHLYLGREDITFDEHNQFVVHLSDAEALTLANKLMMSVSSNQIITGESYD